MKNIQNIKSKNLNTNLSIVYLKGIQYLATIIFVVFCANFLTAQDFETSLRQAAKDLVNPVYAIIEMPQADGTIETIEVLKSELDKISQLENDYEFVRNEEIIIDDSINYLEKRTKKPTKRILQVALTKDYRDTTYLKMIKPASTRIEVIPACRETATERVLVKLGYTKSVTTPAKYKITADTILVKPASYEIPKTLPVEYETVLEIKEMSPATTKWIKRYSKERACGMSFNPEDCQVWVLIEVPARYDTVVKTVLKTPARHKELNTIPAEYKIVYDTVLIDSMKFERVFVPPLYKTITKAVVRKSVPNRIVEIPAEYQTITELQMTDNEKVIELEIPSSDKIDNTKGTLSIQTTDIIQHYKTKR